MNDEFWSGTATGNALDIAAFLDSSVTDGIGGLLAMGVLVSLGLTRDGGAVGVTVFNDGRRRREYFRQSSDCADWLQLARLALAPNRASRPAGNGQVDRNLF